MIRIRLGSSWKHENGRSPVDAVGLEVAEVDLLAGASAEPLVEVMATLCRIVAEMLEGERLGQLSLPDSRLELLALSDGEEVRLAVASLRRPAAVRRGAVSVELPELGQAVRDETERLLEELPLALADERATLAARLEGLRRALESPRPLPRADAPGPGLLRAPSPEAPSFGFELTDTDGRLALFRRGGPGPLTVLALPGAILFRRAPGERVERIEGHPVLLGHELMRQADELSRALELHEPHEVELEGLAPYPVGTDADDGALLLRALRDLGGTLAQAFVQQNPHLADNAYLEPLRPRAGGGHLPPRTGGRALPLSGPRASEREGSSARAQRPLESAGRVRRVRAEPVFERDLSMPEGRVRLMPSRHGVLIADAHAAVLVDRKGRTRARYAASHGLASHPKLIIASEEARALAFTPPSTDARWRCDHDGLPLGPELWLEGGVALASSEERTVAAYSVVTGRELWRIAPTHGRRLEVGLHSDVAWLASDAGMLYAFDLAGSFLRWRLKTPLPGALPPSVWGGSWLGLSGGRDSGHAFLFDPTGPRVRFEVELPGKPLAPAHLLGPRTAAVLVAQTGRPQLLGLSDEGAITWRRDLPLGKGPYTLLKVRRTVVVADAEGSAASVAADGRLRWRLGGPGEPAHTHLPPILCRGMLLLMGRPLRIADPDSGELIGELELGEPRGVAVDRRPVLYSLNEAGRLTAVRLTAHLSTLD